MPHRSLINVLPFTTNEGKSVTKWFNLGKVREGPSTGGNAYLFSPMLTLMPSSSEGDHLGRHQLATRDKSSSSLERM